MMRWWLDRGVDGFRMDVINMISKDPALPDGPTGEDGWRRAGGEHYICGPRIHEFLQEMHREVFDGRDGAAQRRRDARASRSRRRACSPTRRAGELDMVFQFEHVNLDQGDDQVGLHPARPARPQARRSAAGRTGLAEVGLELACTGTTTTSRGSSRAGATTASTASRSAKMLGTRAAPAPRDAVRLPGRGARDDQRAVRLASRTFRDIESLNHYAEASGAGEDPGGRAGGDARR